MVRVPAQHTGGLACVLDVVERSLAVRRAGGEDRGPEVSRAVHAQLGGSQAAEVLADVPPDPIQKHQALVVGGRRQEQGRTLPLRAGDAQRIPGRLGRPRHPIHGGAAQVEVAQRVGDRRHPGVRLGQQPEELVASSALADVRGSRQLLQETRKHRSKLGVPGPSAQCGRATHVRPKLLHRRRRDVVVGQVPREERASDLGGALVNPVLARLGIGVRLACQLTEPDPQGSGHGGDEGLRGRFVPPFDLGDQALGAGHAIGELLLRQAAQFAGLGDPPSDSLFGGGVRTVVTHEQAPHVSVRVSTTSGYVRGFRVSWEQPVRGGVGGNRSFRFWSPRVVPPMPPAAPRLSPRPVRLRAAR